MRSLLVLTSGADDVCFRYRIRPFLPSLQEGEWSVRVESIPNGFWARRKWLGTLAKCDVIWLQRLLLSPSVLRALRAKGKKLIFDFDDAVYQRDSFAGKPPESRQRLSRFRETVRLADQVFAGNSFLAGKASEFTEADKVCTVPTCVRPADYCERRAEEREELVLVWVGSSSTLNYLERSRALWEEIGAALPQVVLKVICDRFPRFENLRVLEVPWSAETEAAEIAASDVGVSVLLEDDWSRGKCGLKLLQYMAAALPVVAQPIGVHTEMVEDGVNGYLPTNSADDWIASLRKLHDERSRIAEMGRKARERVEAAYSVDAWKERVLGWVTQG